MRVLVTGASGFIGGAVLDRLVADGHDALGIGRRALARDRYARIDLERPLDATDLPDGFRPQVVVHAAARASQWGSRARFVAQNVEATRTVLRFAASLPEPARVVHLSTSSVVYRDRDQAELDERSPAGPFLNDYAATKHASERLVAAARVPWVTIRPRAVIGPGDAQLLPRLVDAARSRRLPRFEGSGLPSSLTTIDTLVEAIVRALDRDAALGTVIGVANEEAVPVWEAIDRVLDGLGVPRPSLRLPLPAARALATSLEVAWRAGGLAGEPPITRYGVAVLGTQKRFRTERMRRILGAPFETLDAGLDRVVAAARGQREGAPAERGPGPRADGGAS